MVQDGGVESRSGKRVPIVADTVCEHGDTLSAVAMARAVRTALEAAGIRVLPP